MNRPLACALELARACAPTDVGGHCHCVEMVVGQNPFRMEHCWPLQVAVLLHQELRSNFNSASPSAWPYGQRSRRNANGAFEAVKTHRHKRNDYDYWIYWLPRCSQPNFEWGGFAETGGRMMVMKGPLPYDYIEGHQNQMPIFLLRSDSPVQGFENT